MAESLVAIGPKTARCRRRSSSFRKSNSEDRNIPLASLLRLVPAQFVLWPADPGAFVLEATSMSMLRNSYFSFPSFHLEVQLCQRVTRGPRGAVLGWTGSPCPLVFARDPGTGHMSSHVSETRRTRRKTSPENLRMSVFRDVSKGFLNSENIQNNLNNIQSYSRIYTLRQNRHANGHRNQRPG